VAVVDVRGQPRHGHDDLGVGQARDTVIQAGDLPVELLLGDQGKRRVGAALELAREQAQVSTPALVPGQALGLDDAEQVAQPLVVAPGLPAVVRPARSRSRKPRPSAMASASMASARRPSRAWQQAIR
jgi:hypothetical protein